jgi:uncharacterized protein
MNKINSRSRVPVFVKWIGWVLLVQFILINISASFYAYKLTHFYNDPTLKNATPSKNIFVKTWRLFTGPRQIHSYINETPTFPYDTVQLKSSNGTMIDCWYAKADSNSKGVIILFHGITANKGMMLTEAYEFRFRGYDVMLVDFRAHGNSSGSVTTMGVKESEDVKLAYEFAITQHKNNIFLWGTSMGAVAISKAIADYTFKPAGLILEMPFQSMKSHLEGRARALGFQGIPEKPFGFFVTWWIGMERGIKAFGHKTDSYVSKINCPVLIQWGDQDNYVTRSEIEKIYQATASPSKKFVVYQGASHQSLAQHNVEKWRAETGKFLLENSR